MESKYDVAYCSNDTRNPWIGAPLMENHSFISYANGKSLAEINSTIAVPKTKNFFRMLFAYTGPLSLIHI